MTSFVGNARAQHDFFSALRSGALHHAWLIAGPQGVGKGTFARAAALRLLAEAAHPEGLGPTLEVPESHPTRALIERGSHPDYRELMRLPKEGSKDGELARSITIAQVRTLQPLFATTPSMSPRRVVVIDAAEELERAAANALLKSLEEPPQGTVFLLVSHAPGRLLPPIRSRCRLLRFGALSDDEVRTVLAQQHPQLADEEREALAALSEGAPGRALHFAGLDLAPLERTLRELAQHGDRSNARRLALASTLAARNMQPRYEAFLDRVPAFILADARRRTPASLSRSIGAYEAAREVAASARALSLDAQGTVLELAGIVAGLAEA